MLINIRQQDSLLALTCWPQNSEALGPAGDGHKLTFRPPGSQGRGDRITDPSQNVPEIHPTCVVGGTQPFLGLGPESQKDAVM